MSFKKFLLLIFLFLFYFNAHAQFSFKENTGFSLGITFSVGTHINRIGTFAKAFIYQDFAQLNIGTTYYYNFSGIERRSKYSEFQHYIAILFSHGELDSTENMFLSSVSNQTGKKYSIAYAYNIYRNKIGTSQQTGIFSFGFGKWQLISENDIFAQKATDKFRTASLLLKYRYKEFSFAINTTLWTGNPKGVKRLSDSTYKARYGYKDMSNAPYGKVSAGILAFEAQYALPYYQTIKLSSGIDSEKVRNTLQNKLIHDMYFIPEKINKARNPHMPMIADDGNLYLYKENQKIRPAKYYLKVSANDGIFY